MIRRTILCLLFVLLTLLTSARADDLVAEGAKVKKLAGGMRFTEGPVWVPRLNAVVFSDIPNSKLMKWSEKSQLEVFRQSKQANGNILDSKGRIISCQHRGRNVIRINAKGKVKVLADKYDGKKFNSPNDVAERKDGTLWFTDPHWGLAGRKREIPGNWVYKLNPKSGKVTAVIKDLSMPNGIVFSPDHSRLYVADTGGHPRHPNPKYRKSPATIRCYAITKDGNLGKILFRINHGSDGMAVDVKGNLYTTNAGRVRVHDAKGKELPAIKVPEGPANVCFGGKDYKTLFITARTSLYSVRVKHAGVH